MKEVTTSLSWILHGRKHSLLASSLKRPEHDAMTSGSRTLCSRRSIPFSWRVTGVRDNRVFIAVSVQIGQHRDAVIGSWNQERIYFRVLDRRHASASASAVLEGTRSDRFRQAIPTCIERSLSVLDPPEASKKYYRDGA